MQMESEEAVGSAAKRSKMALENVFDSRNEVQKYLLQVAGELGVSFEDPSTATELDSRDELATFRERFEVPKIGELLEEEKRDAGENPSEECVYFSGNSLGLLPRGSRDFVQQEMDKWGKKGLYGHKQGTYPWYPIEDFVDEQYAMIVGCKKDEVTAMNSLTANIHFALGAFYRPTKERFKIIMEDRCFPSDLFAVQSQIRLHGYDPEVALIRIPSGEGSLVWRTEDIVKVIEEHGSNTAVVFLSGIHYATGHLFDMKTITQVAHRMGIYAGFDLAHAAGNVELHLHDWEVDFAVWCSYKYLNSGPGGIAGFYVHEKHGNNPDFPRLLGWWSHDRASRLEMPPDLSQVLGAKGFHVSNPPILQYMLLIGSLKVFSDTSMQQLSSKSRLLTGYLELLIERNLTQDKSSNPAKYVKIITSQDVRERGCQLSLQFSWPIQDVHQYLSRRGVVTDLRNPDVMRVAPVPLYNSFKDVFRFFKHLCRAIEESN